MTFTPPGTKPQNLRDVSDFMDAVVAYVNDSLATVAFVESNKYVEGDEELRTLRGIVTSGGAVAEGTGWSVSKTGTGAYTVTFDSDFSDVPAVGLGVDKATGTILRLDGRPTKSAFSVTNVTAAGVAADAEFDFVAVGPR